MIFDKYSHAGKRISLQE